jgi:ribosome maturation factor RimP
MISGQGGDVVAHNRKLETEDDFQEAMDREIRIRIFQDDHVIEAGGIIVRFDDELVVTQTGVGDITYHRRNACEFFGMKKR